MIIELISKVAVEFIKQQLINEEHGTLRFCLIGIESNLVNQIAKTVINDHEINNLIIVKIPSFFANDSSLPSEYISDESITHWRHCRLEEGKRGVLFAATHDELQRNDKSVEKIARIETDGLRELNEIWLKHTGLDSTQLDDKKRENLSTCLEAINHAHVARTIHDYGKFVLMIAKNIIENGLTVQKAVNASLPALMLPKNSGSFDRIPEIQRNNISEWKKEFRRLHKKIRPLLMKENEKGESIIEILFENYFEIKDRLVEEHTQIIEKFLYSEIKTEEWTKEQQDFVELDWTVISEIFNGVERRRSVPLGPATIEYFNDEFDDELDEYEIELLSNTLPKPPSDSLIKLFEIRRDQITRDKKLYSQWERYIFGNPQPFDDFFIGLIDTVQRLRKHTTDSDLQSRELVVRIRNSNEKSFWKSKNVNIARYFAFRYCGISKIFSESIKFEFGKLYDLFIPDTDDDLSKSLSTAKDARQLKFEVILDPDGANTKLLFIWEMPPNALAIAMADDLKRIAFTKNDSALLPTADITRQSVSAKGHVQRIALDDINTVRDVNGGNEGNLVAPNKPSGDIGEEFLNKLDKLKSKILSQEQHRNIGTAFVDFASSYYKTICDWVTNDNVGISSPNIIVQGELYGKLLKALLSDANNDLIKLKIWEDILRIGTANVSGGTTAAIITPWHPLRLVEIHVKANQAAKLIESVLNADESEIDQADVLFNQKKYEQKANYYPEVCIGLEQNQSILLSVTESKFDYSIAEPPNRRLMQNGDDGLDLEPIVAARAFSDVGEQYLRLLPHEMSNFSIVLYNAESKALPSAIASELSKKVEQESELQCDLLLTHSDSKRMRQIYEQQNVVVSEESGSFFASDDTRNFLSRMRVGFLDIAEITINDGARASDLVFLQDVISRNASIVWKTAPSERYPKFEEHIPAQWSRRRPVGPADRSSAVYLAAPVQPESGQAYINVVYHFLEGSNARADDVIPAREINFVDGEISKIFKETHRIGEWVVNFDELVDRRLLKNNNINVIRHIPDRYIGRNIVVSTTSKPRLLNALIKDRLAKIDSQILELNDGEIIENLIEQANTLSGKVVMRAARYGHYANELLGVVLSMYLLRKEIGDTSLPLGWFFLDDYASWFGQPEEQIADILAIAPRFKDGKPILRVAIAESKFVVSEGYYAHAKKSMRQLRDTVKRLTCALDPNNKRIDRETWLHRLGDFMLEGIESFENLGENEWSLHQWSDEVRQDKIPIEIIGFSHVFIHDDSKDVDSGTLIPLSSTDHCRQDVFNKYSVAKLLRSYSKYLSGQDEITSEDGVFWKNPMHSHTYSRIEKESSNILVIEKDKKNINDDVDEQSSQGTGNDTSDENQGKSDTPTVEIAKEHGNNKVKINEVIVDSKWPSTKLQEWVHAGRTVGEDSDESLLWLETTVNKLKRALISYDMTAELLDSRLTPNAALVKFRGTDDLTTVKVERRRQELLTSHAIDVINVLGAPGQIIIMVKRPERAILRLRDLWRQRELPEMAPDSNSSLLLGARESDGDLLYLNLDSGFSGYQPHGPHTLIAGETGSGKGVLVQCLLLDICATNHPSNARIIMIDPKAGIDFPWLRQMPHLSEELITEQNRAIEVFVGLVDEMERRNKLLAEEGVTKLSHYNRKVEFDKRLPRIWLFHDELADWMLIDEYREAVQVNVTRLGVKARAAGINLVLVTQRPDRDALPMQLRANLTNRLVLKVADKKNSELVLDEAGAERLLGRGHLAAKLSGEGDIILAQVPFATEEEIQELASIIINAYAKENK